MRTIIKTKAFILLAGVAVFPQPLLAQSISDVSTELETIVVEGGDEGTRSYKSARTSAAGRFDTDSLDVPQSVGVVTQKRFEDQMLETDTDALKYTTGMFVSGAPHMPEISSRGFSTINNVDGLRMGSEDSNFTPMIDTFLLDRLEILRGSAGLLEGAGQPGGMVSRDLKRPLDVFIMEGSVTYGSYNHKRSELDITGPLTPDGGLRGRLVGAVTDTDLFYDHADQTKYSFLGSLEADVTDDTVLRLSALHQKDERIGFWGLPAHEDGYLLDLDRSTFIGSRHGHFNTDYSMVSADLTHEFENGWQAKFKANAFQQRVDELDLMTLSPAYPDGDRLIVDLSQNVNKDEERGYNLDLSVGGDFELLGREHRLVVGASYLRSKLLVDERWGYDSFPVDVLDPDADLDVPAVSDEGIQQDRDYSQFGFYGQVNLALTDQLTAIVGGRVNWAEMTSDITGPNVQDYKEDAFVTPLVGLVYKVTPDTSLYASYADIFEPQFERDADLNALPPLTGSQFELGVKTELLGGRLAASAAAFHIERKNDAYRVGPWPSQVYEADGLERSRGVELEVSGEISPAWRIFAGYTFTDNEVLESRDASRVGVVASNTPRHKAVAWVTHQFQQEALQDLELGAGITAVSSFWDGDNAIEAPGYGTVDAALRYKVNPNFDITMKATNLLDRKYYERLGSAGQQNHYGAPRSFVVQLRGKI